MMLTYYVRHTEDLNIDEHTRNRLWNEEKIAIHYPRDKSGNFPKRPDSRDLGPAHYSGKAAGAIRALRELASEGGYVCAEYAHESKCLLGYISPKSQVNFLEGKWSDKGEYKGRKAILKCLNLRKVKALRSADLAIILVGRPRMGTIARWSKAKDAIKNIVEGIQLEPSLDLLFPYQQEIMCSEFLRSRAAEELGLPRLAHLLLPVGRTVKDFDICGITDSGTKVFVQVTHHSISDSESAEKLALLRPYGDGGKNQLIFVCQCDEEKTQNGVTIVPLDKVYERFAQTDAGHLWIRSATELLSVRADASERAGR